MWECSPQAVAGTRAGRWYVPRRDGAPVRYRGVLRCWREDETFRSFFISLLASAGFDGYRWETPPITTATADRAFEFVLLDEPGLDRPADAEAFAEQCRTAGKSRRVVAFPNLGNDAMLVVPCP